MKKRVRTTVVALLAALIVAQFFRVELLNPPVQGDLAVRPEIKSVLRRACYDCHSNETVWPWYSHVAPVSWLLVRDVREGRDELNFSTWAAYPPAKQGKKLKECGETIAKGEMPPWYYTLVHSDARLTSAERDTLRAWIAGETSTSAPAP